MDYRMRYEILKMDGYEDAWKEVIRVRVPRKISRPLWLNSGVDVVENVFIRLLARCCVCLTLK